MFWDFFPLTVFCKVTVDVSLTWCVLMFLVPQSVRQRRDSMEPAGKSLFPLTIKSEHRRYPPQQGPSAFCVNVCTGSHSSDRVRHGGSEARLSNCRTQIQIPCSPGCPEGTILKFVRQFFILYFCLKDVPQRGLSVGRPNNIVIYL